MDTAYGITRSPISPSVGNQLGRGKVELGEASPDGFGGLKIDPNGKVIEVNSMYKFEIPEGISFSVARLEGGHWIIVNLDKKCSVRVSGLQSLYFLPEPPDERPGIEVNFGEWVEVPMNVNVWPEGARRPDQALFRSREDGKHYKLFKYRDEADPAYWEPSDFFFGGTFSKESWERFAERLPAVRALQAIPDEEGA